MAYVATGTQGIPGTPVGILEDSSATITHSNKYGTATPYGEVIKLMQKMRFTPAHGSFDWYKDPKSNTTFTVHKGPDYFGDTEGIQTMIGVVGAFGDEENARSTLRALNDHLNLKTRRPCSAEEPSPVYDLSLLL